MPLYEYRCSACGEQFEVLQKVDDRPLRRCASCSGKLQKLVSVSSFHLKGGGWYSDGYGSSAKAGASPSKTEPSADAKAESSTSKKPKSGKSSKD